MSHQINASLNLSEEFLNYAGNHASGQYGDGGFFTELDLGYEKYGVATEAEVPYQPSFDANLVVNAATLAKADQLERLQFGTIKSWDNTRGATEAELQSVMTALNFGNPVAVGLLWPLAGAEFLGVAGLQVMKVPATRDDVFDGHSVVLVGYKKSNLFAGGGYVILRNSWGSGFGDGGYALMPFDYLKKYANDFVYYHY